MTTDTIRDLSLVDETPTQATPVVAIVGRPNVGKSTLFNRLTKSRDALVSNYSGLTRDRLYGEGIFEDKPFIVIDTAGIFDEASELDRLMSAQAQLAIKEASIILFIVDARAGLTAADETVARYLRSFNKPIHLVLNKIDGVDVDTAVADFFALGLGEPSKIAAAHKRGLNVLLSNITADFPKALPEEDKDAEPLKDSSIKVAIVGKPNVGKSTLVNRILGEERVTVFDQAGTTRDSIAIPFERRGKKYTLIDTAGVRRRGKVKETVEKFSVIKTLQAIEAANVVVFLIDARENISDQDLRLLGFVLDSGRAVVVAVNKWDDLTVEHKDHVKHELRRRLMFLDFARWHFISALHGSGVGNLFESINAAYKSATKACPTPLLTALLEKAVASHQPPLVQGRRIKLRYAHLGGRNPPIVVIHGNQASKLPGSYKRYLENYFREALSLEGTPIQIELREGENPYATTTSKRKRHK